MSWRTSSLIIFVALTSCQQAGLNTIASDWTVSPTSVDFEATVVGAPRTAALRLINRAPALQVLTIEVNAPFSAPLAVEVEAGAERALVLRFEAEHEGAFEGTLTVRSDAHEETVSLHASATNCPQAEACEQVSAGADGTCARTPLPEGSSCESPCLVSAACIGGACQGTPRSCDDGDACTVDACGAAGCIHQALRCEAAMDPCQVAQCDPALGCVTQPVVDGTACGASDCSTSHVCLAGTCTERPTPEGTRCGPVTPCQSPGTCLDQRCEQSRPTSLRPTWLYRAARGNIDFAGLADAAGNLYWVETGTTALQLVSATEDGVLRFRSDLVESSRGWSYSTFHNMVLTQSLVVLASAPGDLIEAHDQTTGALVWSRHTALALRAASVNEGCTTNQANTQIVPGELRQWSLAADGAGHLALSVASRRSCFGANDLWVVRLDAATGSAQWSKRFGRTDGQFPEVPELAFDEAGQLIVVLSHFPTNAESSANAESSVVSLDAQGHERWRFVAQSRWLQLQSLAGGRLVLASGRSFRPGPMVRIVNTESGEEISQWPSGNSMGTNQHERWSGMSSARQALVRNVQRSSSAGAGRSVGPSTVRCSVFDLAGTYDAEQSHPDVLLESE